MSFDRSKDIFALIESLIEVFISIYEVTLFPDSDDDNEDNSENYSYFRFYSSEWLKSTKFLNLYVEWNIKWIDSIKAFPIH